MANAAPPARVVTAQLHRAGRQLVAAARVPLMAAIRVVLQASAAPYPKIV
jgi:hypothetical protein